jgi:hypothetical protein
MAINAIFGTSSTSTQISDVLRHANSLSELYLGAHSFKFVAKYDPFGVSRIKIYIYIVSTIRTWRPGQNFGPVVQFSVA